MRSQRRHAGLTENRQDDRDRVESGVARPVALDEHRRGFDFNLFGLRYGQVPYPSKPIRRNHISSGTVTSGGTAASRASVHAHQGQRRRMADNSVTIT